MRAGLARVVALDAKRARVREGAETPDRLCVSVTFYEVHSF